MVTPDQDQDQTPSRRSIFNFPAYLRYFGLSEDGPTPVDLSTLHKTQLREGVDLYVSPRQTIVMPEFKERYPKFSIALDGFVYGKPQFDAAGPYLNANHHEDVDRLATRSTCAQIFMYLKQGMLEGFKEDGKTNFNIFINDPDQDTCLAVWLLKNHNRIAFRHTDPRLNRLVELEDRHDVTAGAYPVGPDIEELKELAWIFKPYTDARLSGKLSKMDGAGMATIVNEVCKRIDKHLQGIGEKIELDMRYEVLGGNHRWSLVKEQGAQARTKMFQDGIRAYAAVRYNDDGTYTYTLGKMSPFIPFPITDLYQILNEAEGIDADDPDRWGGGDIIGGSPRERKSNLKPEELEALINKIMDGYTPGDEVGLDLEEDKRPDTEQ